MSRQVSQQRSLEQKRAAKAWEKVGSARGTDYADKYSQLAKSAPATIQANGLGQTLAFWRAKGKGKTTDEHEVIYRDVSDWVKGRLNVPVPDDLLYWVMSKASTDEYRRATVEASAFLIWLKRFAEAELTKDGSP